MNPVFQQQLRCVIFLNNTAVSLLERSCYHQAHTTVQDAKRILEHLGDFEANTLEVDILLDGIQEPIRAANKRLAQPEEVNMNVPFCYMSDSGFLGPAYPIRMDEPETLYVHARGDLSLEFAIVEHNTAFSFFCQACLAETGDTAEHRAATSISLFQASYEKLVYFDGMWTPLHTYVAVNVLAALAKAFFAAGKAEDIEECVRRLESLHVSATELNGSHELEHSACAIGAAAA